MKFITLIVFLLTIFCFSPDSMAKAPTGTGECVILLHGMGRTGMSMQKLARHLAKEGFKTVNFSYQSTNKSIENIADKDIPDAIAMCEKNGPSGKIHFVTHSLGGIIVRQYLQTNLLQPGSRIVMISPPNKGSEVTDHFKDFL